MGYIYSIKMHLKSVRGQEEDVVYTPVRTNGIASEGNRDLQKLLRQGWRITSTRIYKKVDWRCS